jgi:tetratricopeptide (TPR) repeat protein
MRYQQCVWFLGGMCAFIFPTNNFGQSPTEITSWAASNDAGAKAYQQGRLAEAESLFKDAVTKAETLVPEDMRLASCLNNLAATYVDEGKRELAEPLYKRSMRIEDRAVGSDDPEFDYFSLRSQDALKLLLDTTVKAYQQSLDLTLALYETGIDSEEAVAQAQTQLNSTARRPTGLDVLHRSGTGEEWQAAGNSLGGAVAAAGTPTGYRCVGTAGSASQRTNWYRESGIFSYRYVKRRWRLRDFVHQPMVHLAQPILLCRTVRGGNNF